MMVPPKVRGFLGGHLADYDDALSKITVLVFVTQVTDGLCAFPAMSECTLSAVKHGGPRRAKQPNTAGTVEEPHASQAGVVIDPQAPLGLK